MDTNHLQDFLGDLRQDVLARAGDESTPRLREDAFTEIVLETLTDHNEVFDWELCSHNSRAAGRSPATKLSAWSLSGDGATLDLFIAHYNDTNDIAEIGRPEARRQFELLRGFLDRSRGGWHVKLEESTDVFRAAQHVYDARANLTTVRLFLITDGIVKAMPAIEADDGDLDVTYVFWDLEKLSQLRPGSRQEIMLNFVDNHGGTIACLEASDAGGEYCTYLLFLPAPLLAQIYGQFGQRLLERNVRAFLQTKGNVNKGLQRTLKDEPHRFLAYNNGLCCTAAEVGMSKRSNGHAQLEWARDFQIVNGGQTTASIYHAVKKERLNVGDVLVQVKLTVLNDPEEITAIVPLIAKYANSQNKVNAADLAANGTFHRSLEELSRTIWAPAVSGVERGTHWYYERARGSYQDDKVQQSPLARQKEWVRQNPTNQRFSKTDLAKFEHAWLGLPHLVSRGSEKNFKAFAERLEVDGDPVVDESYFHRTVAKALLWRSAERSFNTARLQHFRAQSVAYGLAWFGEFTHRKLDLESIWRRQSLTSSTSDMLGRVVLAARAYLGGLPGNIGEAAKKADCWDRFRTERIETVTVIADDLTSQGEPPAKIGHATAEESAAISEAASRTGAYWFQLSTWAKERSFLQPWQRALCFSMGRLATRGVLPSPKQAIQALKIIARADELGFRPDGGVDA